jgi:hypothetical protein
MRHAIDTAPRDGKAIILEDDASATYGVAHWSPEAGEWVGEKGEPIKITPTHWYPMPRDQYLLREGARSGNPSHVGRARRRLAASSIMALIAAAFAGLYFRTEVATYVTRYAGQYDISGLGTIGAQVVEQATEFLNHGLEETYLLTLQQQAEADQARVQAGVQEAAQVKQAMEASAPEAGQSLAKEPRPESLEQEREQTSALALDAAAAPQELTASTGQHRQALQEERARGAALASELAMARREIETNAALLNMARDDAAKFKQIAERTTAEQQQARDSAEALSRKLALARREIETNAALLNMARYDAAKFKQTAESTTAELQQARDSAEALSRELALARREIETNLAVLNKARDDAAKFKETTESTMAAAGARQAGSVVARTENRA